ncbi:MAG: glycosyltransferase family 2 protein [Henriciella sp.]
MSKEPVSAIVVTFNTGPRLKECLYALHADPDVFEIVVVDNGNPADMQTWLEDFASARAAVELCVGQGNIGFGAAVNLGVDRANGPHLLVINPDAVLRRNSIAPLQQTATGLSDPWIIGGKIFDLYGREERGPRRKELTLWRSVNRMIGINNWTLEQTPPPDGPIEMPVISGAFFLTSKGSMARLSGFDEDYFLHVEDVDLCRRCREAGGTVMYDPRAGALHYGSTSDAPSRIVSKHKADSLARYFRKFATGPLSRIMAEIAIPFIRLGMRLKSN